MAGANGPTSAAGTNDTKHPDAQPAGGGGAEPAGAGAVEVETPAAKPGDGKAPAGEGARD